MELLDYRQTGPGSLERLEEQTHRGLHLGGSGSRMTRSSASCKMRGIVQSILIEDECIAERGQLKKPMPIGGVTRQARHFQAEHDPGAVQADFGHQTLEAFPVSRTGARLAEVTIDHDNPSDKSSRENQTRQKRGDLMPRYACQPHRRSA